MGDWLTIIIVLLILGILLDGWRRMRRAHRESLKVSPALRKGRATSGSEQSQGFGSASTQDYTTELPNGGARVAYREQMAARRANSDSDAGTTEEEASEEPVREDSASELKTPSNLGRREGQIPEQVALNLDESVPILMETTDDESAPDEATDQGRIEPTLGEAADSTQKRNAKSPKPSRSKTPSGDSPGTKTGSGQTAKSGTGSSSSAGQDIKPPEEVLIVNLMAPSGQAFRGDALLDALLQGGLRFGDMNIFHRYEKSNGGGAILFSLANMVKPGTFDLDQMDDFTTPGVSLFMTLPLEASEFTNTQVFDLMLDTAQTLAEELGGELKDENRSVMTRQTMEHCRQRIHEFERKQLFRSDT